MSANALAGNTAEKLFCIQPSVISALTAYFNKPLAKIIQAESKKKTDVIVKFEDGEECRIQLKAGGTNTRGFSIDRRPVDRIPCDERGRQTIETLCLKKIGGFKYTDVSSEESKKIIRSCFLGDDAKYSPTHFVHLKIVNEIVSMKIVSSEKLLNHLYESLYPNMVPKRTCVHLNPAIYLQRKGGGSSDKHPDHIQAKLKFNVIEPLFENIQFGGS